jgi:hypothetical protein
MLYDGWIVRRLLLDDRRSIDRSIRRTVGSRLHTPGSQITVSKIPEYDPTGLPFWNIYIKEGKSRTIRVGGTDDIAATAHPFRRFLPRAPAIAQLLGQRRPYRTIETPRGLSS